VSGIPLAGWVPIRLIWQGAEPLVEWCYLGRERFTHPFFDGTIQFALQTPFNSLFRHHTSMATLAEWSRRSPGIPPSGFVFHMSRCGSTVVSQLLASLPENVVVSEAGPLDALARAHLRAPSSSLEQRIAWLQWMVSALGQRRGGGERHYFIKFDARTTFELPLLRQAFPEVPWIFVYRDPVEVLVSLVNRPSNMTTPGMGANLLSLPMSQIGGMAFEEYAARVLGLLCEAASGQFTDKRGLLVNYRQIPSVVWGELPGHFGFELAAGAIERVKAAATLDAKDRGRLFEGDSARRQAEASEDIRRAAEQWVAPQYEKLERLRGQGLA
jgi:hypothetical protein